MLLADVRAGRSRVPVIRCEPGIGKTALLCSAAHRAPAVGGDLAGLPGLVVGPLSCADARALLASAIPGRLDEPVRDRIVAESGGNPLALLELPRAVTAAELAGVFGVAGAAPLAGRVAQRFLRRRASPPGAAQGGPAGAGAPASRGTGPGTAARRGPGHEPR